MRVYVVCVYICLFMCLYVRLYFCLLGKYMSLDVHVCMEKVHMCMFITMHACTRPIIFMSCQCNCVF